MAINQRSPMPTHELNYNPLFEAASASLSSQQQGREGGPDPLQLLHAELQSYVKKQSNEALEARKWNVELSLQEAKTSKQKEIRRLEGTVRALETTSQNMHGRMHKLEEVCASLHAAVTSLHLTLQDAGICAADMQLVRQQEFVRATDGLKAMDLPRHSSASSLVLPPRVPLSHSHMVRGVLTSDASYAVYEDYLPRSTSEQPRVLCTHSRPARGVVSSDAIHEDNLSSASQRSTSEQPRVPLSHSHLARRPLPSDPSYAACDDNLSSLSQRSTLEDSVQGHGALETRVRPWAVSAPGTPPQPPEPGAWADGHRHTRKVRWAKGAHDRHGTCPMRQTSTCAVFSEGIPDTSSQLARFRTSLQHVPPSSEASSAKSRGPHACNRSSSSRALLGGGGAEGQQSASGKSRRPLRATSDENMGHKHGGEAEEKANEGKGLLLQGRVHPPKSTYNKSLQGRDAESSLEGRQGGSFRWMPSRRFTLDGGTMNGRDVGARQGTGTRKGHRLKPKAEEEEEDKPQDDLGFLIVHPRIKFGAMSHWADAHERVSATLS